MTAEGANANSSKSASASFSIGSVGSTKSAVSEDPYQPANADACFSARSEASDKSIGQRMRPRVIMTCRCASAQPHGTR